MDRNLLARATEGTDAPTPGYLYVDLTKAATSNPSACAEMAQYLTRKLQNKQNPNVKAKCCKVIAKLAEQVPRNQFRRCIAQDSQAVAAIKEAINFRGPMDPVQGDAKNERVRAAAREALEAVYKESPTSEQIPAPMHAMSASYGSTPHGSGGYNGGIGGGGGGGGYSGGSSSDYGGSRRMEGIGNPMYSDPRNDPRYNNGGTTTFQETIRGAGEVVRGMIMDPLARNIGQPAPNVPSRGHSGNLPGYGPSYGHSSGPPGASELSRQTGGQWTMASNRGPGAIHGPATSEYYKERDRGFNSWNNASGGESTSAKAGVPGGSWGSTASQAREPNYGTPSVQVVHNPSASGGAAINPGGTGSSDGSYEKNLILELCPPGGVKPVPPPDKLAAFARSVSNLNSELICPALLDFLEDGQPWIIRAKALCVMETAIQNGVMMSDGSNPYKTFFYACAEEIQPLAVHPRPAISEPARRVLLLLGITPGPSHDNGGANNHHYTVSAPPVAAPPVVSAPNLLDFDDNNNNGQDAPPPAQPPSQPPPPPPSEATPAPSAAVAPAAPSNSMFGGMTVKGASAAAAVASAAPRPSAPPAAAPAPPQDAGSLLDFSDPFDPAPSNGSNGSKPSEASTSAAASMFGELSIKDEKKKDDDTPKGTSAPTAPLGSAFGFINSATPAPATPTPVASTAEPKSFDPLKNAGFGASAAFSTSMPTATASMSPTGMPKTMMALSTEQMQAMAYQQMMMQQQMQQMQMAAMIAHQRGGMPPPPMPMQFRQSSGSGMPGVGFAASSKYQPAKKDDKKFDFVKDAMVSAEKKK
ncbi:hypothetical protein ACA910_019982 [Epithemia clementina (nom. ined.)]